MANIYVRHTGISLAIINDLFPPVARSGISLAIINDLFPPDVRSGISLEYGILICRRPYLFRNAHHAKGGVKKPL